MYADQTFAARDMVRWSCESRLHPAQLVAAALAMAGPITYGVTTGHLTHASFAALGALAVNFVHPPTIRRPFSWLAGAQSRVGVVVTGAALLGARARGGRAVVSVLAGLRPLLKERNYAAYAAVMTPLVVLLMDLGRTPVLSTIGYRLIDTVIGCLIAILPTLVLRRRHVA